MIYEEMLKRFQESVSNIRKTGCLEAAVVHMVCEYATVAWVRVSPMLEKEGLSKRLCFNVDHQEDGRSDTRGDSFPGVKLQKITKRKLIIPLSYSWQLLTKHKPCTQFSFI